MNTGYAANGLNQYATVAGASYVYDSRGNLTNDGCRAFTYDEEKRDLSSRVPERGIRDRSGKILL